MCFVIWFEWFWCSFWGVLGCNNDPRQDNSYAYLPKLAGNQIGQNYDGLLVKVIQNSTKYNLQ